MNVTATLNGESVTIVGVEANGTEIYISYVNSANEMRYTKKIYNYTEPSLIIATDATVG